MLWFTHIQETSELVNMGNPRLQRLKSVLDLRQPDLRVFLECVHKPHNMSAIMRTCDAVGVQQVHAVALKERFSYGPRSSSGMGKWIHVTLHEDVATGIDALRTEGLRVYAAHFSDRAMDYRDVDYTQPTAILMGAELEGVSESAADLVDNHIKIPMSGLGSSLNVSVAAGVILYEAQRQRAAAGCYRSPRLGEKQYAETLFEWLYPRVAEACRRRGVRYPSLDEDGDVIGNSAALESELSAR